MTTHLLINADTFISVIVKALYHATSLTLKSMTSYITCGSFVNWFLHFYRRLRKARQQSGDLRVTHRWSWSQERCRWFWYCCLVLQSTEKTLMNRFLVLSPGRETFPAGVADLRGLASHIYINYSVFISHCVLTTSIIMESIRTENSLSRSQSGVPSERLPRWMKWDLSVYYEAAEASGAFKLINGSS